jgi:hypothetical protein
MFAVRLKIIVGRYFLNGAEWRSCAYQSLIASLSSKSAIARRKRFVSVAAVLRVNALHRPVESATPSGIGAGVSLLPYLPRKSAVVN